MCLHRLAHLLVLQQLANKVTGEDTELSSPRHTCASMCFIGEDKVLSSPRSYHNPPYPHDI